MENFELFCFTENTFSSPKLIEVMKPFEDGRARIEAYKCRKEKGDSLEISGVSPKKSDIVSFEVKGKGEVKGKEERKTTSSLKENDDDTLIPDAPLNDKIKTPRHSKQNA